MVSRPHYGFQVSRPHFPTKWMSHPLFADKFENLLTKHLLMRNSSFSQRNVFQEGCHTPHAPDSDSPGDKETYVKQSVIISLSLIPP